MITLSFHSPTDETARAIIAPLLFTCTVLANRCYYHPSILPSYQQNQGNFDSTVTVNNGSDVACPTAPRGSNMTTTNRNSAGRCSSIASSPASDDSSIIAAPTKIAVSEAHSRPAPHEESTCWMFTTYNFNQSSLNQKFYQVLIALHDTLTVCLADHQFSVFFRFCTLSITVLNVVWIINYRTKGCSSITFSSDKLAHVYYYFLAFLLRLN